MEILKVIEGNIADILDSSPSSENVLILAKANDLKEFARQIAMAILRQPQDKPFSNKPLTSQEACTFLQITMPTLMKYRRKGFFKGHIFDGKVYYFEDELVKELRSRAGVIIQHGPRKVNA
jgi:hypothetical protein